MARSQVTDGSFLPSFPKTLEGERILPNLRQRMVRRYRRASTFGTAANAPDGSAIPQFSKLRSDVVSGELILSLPKMLSVANALKIRTNHSTTRANRRKDVTLHDLWLEK